MASRLQERGSMKSRTLLVFGFVWLACVFVICAFWGTVLYAAVHFLLKVW